MVLDLDTWHAFCKRQGSRELRDILMLWWDPLGVHGVPEALDEYDTQVGQIGHRLRKGGSVEDITAYLEANDFGLPDSSRDRAAAVKVVEWYEQSMKRLGEFEDEREN